MERGSIGIALIGPNALLREALAHIISGAVFQILASAPRLDDSAAASLPQEHPLLIIEASSDIDATVREIETFKVTVRRGGLSCSLINLSCPRWCWPLVLVLTLTC